MGTKLGAHVLKTASGLADYIQAKPAIVKFVGDWGMAPGVPSGTLVIGRKYNAYDAQSQFYGGLTPRDAAENFVRDQRETYLSNPAIVYWEGHNEPVWNTREEMEWYAEFEFERMMIMADMGLKCVIGNFATGTPALDLWPYFGPVCQAGQAYEAILGLHEYSCPWMWWMTGGHQLDPNEDQGDEGWTTLRYRKVYRQHLIPNDAVIPLAITECGIDGLVNPKPPGAPSATWQGLGNYWREENGETDKHDYYFRQLVWYDKELQKDDYVVGATVFTWGSWGHWASFDVADTPVASKLTDYTLINPAKPFTYTEEEGTPPGRGAPRVQYDRTYILLPPTADSVWMEGAVEATFVDAKTTIGSSADDAGIGDLDVRRIIAVNPDEWPGNLRKFYEEFYPGVEYVEIYCTLNGLRSSLCDALGLEEPQSVLMWQCDPRWNVIKYAPYCDQTICQAGCYITCMAMAQRIYGIKSDATPLTVMEQMGPLGFSECDVLRSEAYRCGLEIRYAGEDEAELFLRSGGCAMAEVIPGPPTHFVLVTEQVGGRFWMLDSYRNIEGWLDEYHSTPESWRLLIPLPEEEKPTPDTTMPYIYGTHEDSGHEAAGLMEDEGINGYIVFTEALGANPDNTSGRDYTTNAESFGHTAIARLNYGYGSSGTIPTQDQYLNFAQRVENFVRNSTGCHIWIIGNEMNNPREWPGNDNGKGGYVIYPEDYARLFNDIYDRILYEAPGDMVIPGAIDGYNSQIGYSSMGYMARMWAAINDADGVCCHTYTHGPNPELIRAETLFGHSPMNGVHYDFRNFMDQLDMLPNWAYRKPIYITETNHLYLEDHPDPQPPTFGWLDQQTGWIPEAYKFIDELNRTGLSQQIALLALYRWPAIDDWVITGKQNVIADFRAALKKGYRPYIGG